jgi:hypothetical protein
MSVLIRILKEIAALFPKPNPVVLYVDVLYILN